MLRKILASSVLLAVTASFAYADTIEIDCSTDPVFAEYSCNQCFDGGTKAQGEYIGLMTDIWRNDTGNKKLLYKEIQKMPELYTLDSARAEWSQVPSATDFWEYTPDLEALYSSDFDGYVLDPGQSVTWIKSKLDSAYKLDRNEVAAGGNVGLLVYSINSSNILDSGEPSTDFSEHNECVLYKSGDTPTVTPPTTLPQTGPAEFFLLLILAMVLGFGIVKFRNSNA